MARRRTQNFPSALVLVLVFLAVLVPPALSYDADFSFYPSDSQPCLNAAARMSKCTGDSAKDLNKCLCSNGGDFITYAASCLGRSDKENVSKVYETMKSACSYSKTPLSVSKKEFMDAANGDSTTTTYDSGATSSTSTTRSTSSTSPTSSMPPTTSTTSIRSSGNTGTSTATPTQSNSSSDSKKGDSDESNKSGGLSKGATIGIAVGTSVGGMLAIGAMVLFLRHRQNKEEEESNPMMMQNDYDKRNIATTFPPTEPSPAMGQFLFDPKASWGSSPSPGCPSPGHLPPSLNKSPVQYTGPYASPQDENPAIQGPGGLAFEMDASTVSTPPPGGAISEMEGSPPTTHQFQPYRPPHC